MRSHRVKDCLFGGTLSVTTSLYFLFEDSGRVRMDGSDQLQTSSYLSSVELQGTSFPMSSVSVHFYSLFNFGSSYTLLFEIYTNTRA